MIRKLFSLAVILLILVACQPDQGIQPAPGGSAIPTETTALYEATDTAPQPTHESQLIDTPLPPTATPTAYQEITPTPTLTPDLPTLAASTEQATSIPQPAANSAAIQFHYPGHLSRVTSPVGFYGYAIPGFGRKGTIQLSGEDGTLLAEELLQLNTDYKWAFFYWGLDFIPRGAGELGRLTLSTRDQYERLTAVQSVHLILLPGGNKIINPIGDLTESCLIVSPLPGTRVSGGSVSVSGIMRPYNDLPLIVELVSTEDAVIGMQLASIPQGSAGLNVPFDVEIQYTINKPSPALLRVSQQDDRIGGLLYLYSQEIYLNP